MSSDNQTTPTGLHVQAAASSRRGSRSHHGDGGDCGHRGVGHHFPGFLRCPGRGVQTPLLPPPRPAAPLWLQVSDLFCSKSPNIRRQRSNVVNPGSSAAFSDPRWIWSEPWRPRVSRQSWSWTMWSSPTPTSRPSWRMRTGSRTPRRPFGSFFPLLLHHLVWKCNANVWFSSL